MSKNATLDALCIDLVELVVYDDNGDPNEPVPGVGASIAPGVIICFITSCLQALGMAMQKYAHAKQQALPEPQRTPVYRMAVWHVGLWIYLISQLAGQPLALIFIPPSIVAPLGSITLAFNALFAYLMLGERFTIKDLIGTLVAAGGAVLIAYFGYAPQGTFDIAQLIQLFGSPTMIVYMCLFLAYVVLSYSFGRFLEWCSIHGDAKPSWLANYSAGKLLEWRAFIHATIAGALGASVLLLGKAAVEIGITTFTYDDNQFTDVGTYFILGSLAVVGVFQMVFLNSALAAGEQRIVVPIFFCFFTVLSMIETMVYFDQWVCFSPLSSVFIAVGIVVMLIGVWFLSQPKTDAKELGVSDALTTEATPLLRGEPDVEQVSLNASMPLKLPAPVVAQAVDPSPLSSLVQDDNL